MKIRTDFVTNSSSSSFAVEIIIRDDKGNDYSALIDPSRGERDASVNVTCSAEDIMNEKSVKSLLKLLTNSLVDTETGKACRGQSFNNFKNDVNSNVSDISQISNIKLKRIWFAWGEAASCFGWNLDSYAPDLPKLAKRVGKSVGDEKEKAKKDMIEYLSHYNNKIDNDWGDHFPSGFMGSSVEGSIVWNQCAETIEEFAQKVLDENLPRHDYAEETVDIDINNSTVKRSAEYILGGFPPKV